VKIPTNKRTIAFAILEGATLSFPAGLVLEPIRPFKPPGFVAFVCVSVFLLSFLSLPIWCLVSLRKHPVLASIGIVTWILVLGFIFPQINND
jgi:hypothetical protein